MRVIARIVALVLIVGTTSSAYGQNNHRPLQSDVGETQVLPKGAIVVEQSSAAGQLPRVVILPDEVQQLIVVFEAPPLALLRAEVAGKAGRSAEAFAADIKAQQAQFVSDLGRLDAVASKDGSAVSRASEIRRTYRFALNGAAVTTSRRTAQEIAALPYVKGVYEDRQVSVVDESSNRVIGADRARAQLGATGAGVTVAIIDSGVDYLHPALGGGFGAGFKVIGGYDFIDEDADPMDGNGHGTHVAGIVAGDDGASFLGVAPEARLRAYRVLNDAGSGETSGVIAAIEHAVDPDGDPATDDGADVINLSLGGDGHPDDPAAQAVDNATLAGVVCVVAAGNDGRSYAIGSPGVARSAITVGASDNADILAFFSSRGPTSIGFENKPDVVAPGVQIMSTVLSGAYDAYSGTSMATPHVAGAVALLLERHPVWSPGIVKSALMTSATKIGGHLWEQGAGRIDIMAADGVTAALMPSSLSFGNLDPAQTSASFQRNIVVRNLSSTEQTWNTAASHALPGLSMQVSPSSVRIAPGSAATVSVTASFQTANLPFPSDINEPYAGDIILSGNGKTMRVPFSVTKTPQLILEFDEPPDYVSILSREGGVASSFARATLQSFPLPTGVYDVMVQYSGQERAYVIVENIEVTGRHERAILRSSAKNKISFDARGKDGQALSKEYGDFLIERKKTSTTGWYSSSISGWPVSVVWLSDVSSRFKIESVAYHMSVGAGDDYVIPFALPDGVTSSVTLQNDPATLKSVTSSYVVPSSVTELFVVPNRLMVAGEQLTTSYSWYSEELLDHHRLTAPFHRTVYYGPKPYRTFGFRYQSDMTYDTSVGEPPSQAVDGNMAFMTSLLEIQSDSIKTYPMRDFSKPIRATTLSSLEQRLGAGPVGWAGRMWNIGSSGWIRFNQLHRLGLFTGSEGEIIGGNVHWSLRRSGDLLHQATFANGLSTDVLTGYPADRYDIEVKFDGGYVGEWPVKAEVYLSFDTEGRDQFYDPDPPLLGGFILTSGGENVTALDPTKESSITAIVQDTYNAGGPVARAVGAAQVHVRRIGETDWTQLSSERSGDRFAAEWPAESEAGYYDLRVTAEDLAGGRLDYRVRPGFLVGTADGNRAPSAPSALLPADGMLLTLDSLAGPIRFSWEASIDEDAGQNLRYEFRLWGGELDTAQTTSGTSLDLDLRDVLESGSTYAWTVEVTDGFARVGPGASNSITTTGTRVDAETPAHELPESIALHPNYPNPFNPSTTLSFALPAPAHARLAVYDVLGRRVALLVEEKLAAGLHERSWSADALPSGVYFARLDAGGRVLTRQLVLMK